MTDREMWLEIAEMVDTDPMRRYGLCEYLDGVVNDFVFPQAEQYERMRDALFLFHPNLHNKYACCYWWDVRYGPNRYNSTESTQCRVIAALLLAAGAGE